MKRLVSLVIVIIPVILVVGWLANEGTSVAQKIANQSFPSGDWNFSAHPYMGQGYDTQPDCSSSPQTTQPNMKQYYRGYESLEHSVSDAA